MKAPPGHLGDPVGPQRTSPTPYASGWHLAQAPSVSRSRCHRKHRRKAIPQVSAGQWGLGVRRGPGSHPVSTPLTGRGVQATSDGRAGGAAPPVPPGFQASTHAAEGSVSPTCPGVCSYFVGREGHLGHVRPSANPCHPAPTAVGCQRPRSISPGGQSAVGGPPRRTCVSAGAREAAPLRVTEGWTSRAGRAPSASARPGGPEAHPAPFAPRLQRKRGVLGAERGRART